MSLSYSHPKDMYDYAKSVDRKLTTMIELLSLHSEALVVSRKMLTKMNERLTILNEQNEQQIKED